MAVTTNKVVRLTFTTAGGKTFSITIPDPREDLDKLRPRPLWTRLFRRIYSLRPAAS